MKPVREATTGRTYRGLALRTDLDTEETAGTRCRNGGGGGRTWCMIATIRGTPAPRAPRGMCCFGPLCRLSHPGLAPDVRGTKSGLESRTRAGTNFWGSPRVCRIRPRRSTARAAVRKEVLAAVAAEDYVAQNADDLGQLGLRFPVRIPQQAFGETVLPELVFLNGGDEKRRRRRLRGGEQVSHLGGIEFDRYVTGP